MSIDMTLDAPKIKICSFLWAAIRSYLSSAAM